MVCGSCGKEFNDMTLLPCPSCAELACPKCSKDELCRKCMEEIRDRDHEEAVRQRSSGAEPPQDLQSTANTSECLISDSVLSHAKLTLGMLADWGGRTYEGDMLSDSLDKRERQHLQKRCPHLKE